jgi:hypothetical protein
VYYLRNDRDRSDIEIDLTALASMRIRWAGHGSNRTFLGKSEIGEQRSDSEMESESFISTGLLRYGVSMDIQGR